MRLVQLCIYQYSKNIILYIYYILIYSKHSILYIHTKFIYLYYLLNTYILILIYSTLYILYYTILYYTDTTTTTTRTLAAQTSTTPQLPPADAVRLKNQSFVRPERVKEVLENLQSVLLQRVPDLKALMKVRRWVLLRFMYTLYGLY